MENIMIVEKSLFSLPDPKVPDNPTKGELN